MGDRECCAHRAVQRANVVVICQKCGTNTPGYADAVVWLPDSKRLVMAQSQTSSGVFDATTGQQVAKFEFDVVGFKGFAILKDGVEAVGTAAGGLHVYRHTTIARGTSLSSPAIVNRLAHQT